MLLDIILLSLALVMCLVGVIGAVAPGLPGPPVSFVGLLLLVLCPGLSPTFSVLSFLLVSLLLAIVVTVLDFVAPVWFTKHSGGSKAGVRGATIGMIVGLVISFFGLFLAVILGPFIGAYVGEKMAGTPSDSAFKVACYSFLSFILTTGIKLIYGFAALGIVVYEGAGILFS